ncbi:MAG: cytochrome c oxidase subunit II [Halofilum sp. (in: g-proteobacteria)]|nr:cytochrome c oxidase subunit II [Halofilum sp. (in: g-proteobacteria)]
MFGVSSAAHAEWALNMPVGVTPISGEVYKLHMLIFGICVLIGIVVFGVIVWSLIHHRKSKGHEAAQFHESTKVEIAWTIVPFLILIAMAIPAARVLVNMEDSSDPGLTVKITGYQWKWHYEYLDEGVSFYSTMSTTRQQILNEADKGENYLIEVDNELVLPVDTKIRFHHTAGDVLHAWWVPALSVKKDAIPGYINTNWARIDEPGVYRGKCAELCGRGHGFMPIVVRAVPKAEFEDWIAGQQQAQAEQGTAGEDVVASIEQ